MQPPNSIHRVAIIGTGTIGASWATHFLVRGLDVVAADPAPGAEQRLRQFVAEAWATAAKLGLAEDASPDRLHFTSQAVDAVKDADFVQENGPERLDFKIQLFAALDKAAPAHALLASSSSGITMSVIQTQCTRPERTVTGHPFNPPHVIPLVEVVGGSRTSPETVQRAIDFYTAIGKRPIHLKKEIPGHVANRLQAALYREIAYLINEGVLDVADCDDAVSWGPGLRWGVMGPSMLWHLNGGSGGIQHFMDTLMKPLTALWPTLGNPAMSAELQQKIVEGVLAEAGGRSLEELERERDEMLLGLEAIRAKDDNRVGILSMTASTTTRPAPPQVLIIGGISAARRLGSVDAEVTLLDRGTSHVFQPLLYQGVEDSSTARR